MDGGNDEQTWIRLAEKTCTTARNWRMTHRGPAKRARARSASSPRHEGALKSGFVIEYLSIIEPFFEHEQHKIRAAEICRSWLPDANSDRIPRLRACRVADLIGNFRRVISVNRNLNFFTSGYNYMIQLIPVLLVAPLFIRREVEFGVIGQATMAFATLLGAFSLVITQFQAISVYASVLLRLGEFVASAEKCGEGIPDPES